MNNHIDKALDLTWKEQWAKTKDEQSIWVFFIILCAGFLIGAILYTEFANMYKQETNFIKEPAIEEKHDPLLDPLNPINPLFHNSPYHD